MPFTTRTAVTDMMDSGHSTPTTTSQRTSSSTKNTSIDDRATAAAAAAEGRDRLPASASEKLPSTTDMDAAGEQMVWNANGVAIPFRKLISGDDEEEEEKKNGDNVDGSGSRSHSQRRKRVMAVFVRHFFCGNCQEYLRTLSQLITPDSLHALSEPTSIIVIGCGSPDLIPMYIETTGCRFPIYADPSRKIFDLLGMTKTLTLGPARPDYMRRSLLTNIVLSFVQVIKSGNGAFKGGDYRQVGGEFLFEDGKLVWCHRMKNTRDHGEVPVLKQLLGFDVAKDAR
ncbi:MAG: hypothetical protein M1816_001811 [Peltula sp. TS41687]|nr:MAG: hypothetical protein M1816_001811 [Peltula sp. TS41687]